MSNERDENGAGTSTLARSRDRASQIDFLRELSLARRGGSSPYGPQRGTDDPSGVAVDGEPGLSNASDEASWTMAFVTADSETAVEPESSTDDWATDDSDGAGWRSFPTDAALRPSNWFDRTGSEPTSEPVAPVIGLFDILPVSIWPDPAISDTAERSVPDVDQGLESAVPGEVGSVGEGSVSAGGLFDLLPATIWPAVVADEPALSGTSGDVGELLAPRSWVFDRSEPMTEAGLDGASSMAHRAIDETSHTVEYPQAAPPPPPDPVTITGPVTALVTALVTVTSPVTSPALVTVTSPALVTVTSPVTSPVTVTAPAPVTVTDPAPVTAPGSVTALAPVTVGERVGAYAPTPTTTPGNRPPTITAAAPVVARCSGLVASQSARGRRVPVLSGVDLTVRSGEVVVITGRSGSGKTTLLECLVGLHRVDAGTITIGEGLVGDSTEEQIADLRATTIGYVAQEPQLLADLSAIENIELPLLLSGWDPVEARTEADAAVSLVGLQHPTFRASELSSGERRRVAIARALVGEPSILWLDDASAAIDPETMAEIYELIVELCHDGLTVVAVTHDPVMLAFATSSYELRNGSLHPVVA